MEMEAAGRGIWPVPGPWLIADSCWLRLRPPPPRIPFASSLIVDGDAQQSAVLLHLGLFAPGAPVRPQDLPVVAAVDQEGCG